MPFPQSFLDELIARNDIVDVVGSYVSLTPKGGSFWGCCPFHNEKTPSFHVLPDKQIYHCFGCKKGGGVINFIMEEREPVLSRRGAVSGQAGRHAGAGGGPATARRQLRRRMLGLNRDAARLYYQTPPGRRRARPSGTIWTGGRSTGGSPCASAWGPRRTAGTPC